MATSSAPHPPRIGGVLLAAGSGRRFGGPKALADTGDGPWVLRALATLEGTDPQIVVVGAAADDVIRLLPPTARAAYNPDHHTGMGSSLIAGLAALSDEVDAALIMLVDLPDVPPAATRRLLDYVSGLAQPQRDAPHILARASYHGQPSHPVLIGKAHFSGVAVAAQNDKGARDYLASGHVILIECGDLGSGDDVDELTS